MNKDERNGEKQRKEEKKTCKKTQKPNQRESDKNFRAGQLVVHLSPSVVCFYGGGVQKNRENLVYVVVEFLVVGTKYLFFTVFFEGNDNGFLGSADTNLQASWLSTP